MRLCILLPLLAAPLLIAAAGCSDDEDTATSTTSTSTSTTAASSSGAGGGSAGVHDCDPATAVDFTAQMAATIMFSELKYTPSCVRVKAGTDVTFQGDFSLHPLVGGEFKDGIKTPDDTSPIKSTNMGMSATFTLDTPGTYPFYCDFHASVKMYGAVFVE